MDKSSFGGSGADKTHIKDIISISFYIIRLLQSFYSFSLKVFMSTFLLYYFSTIWMFVEDAIVMFHFSCKGSTSKASYRHFSSFFSQNPLFCKIFTIYLQHVPKGAWHILLNRCLNHHLGKSKKSNSHSLLGGTISADYPIKNGGLWWAKTAYGESLRFLFF